MVERLPSIHKTLGCIRSTAKGEEVAGMVVNSYNPSYSGDRDREDCDLSPTI
jgi:hypothetical protein